MFIATCVLKIDLPAVFSLKEKRRIVKSILTRVRREFNLAVAEVDHHDVWGTAVLALVTVGTDKGHLHGRLEKAITWIQQQRPDLPLDDYYIEFR
ncbi:MAG TPA: DUF503 domain-containing protein [Anaerolineae bacterium]|nr:DUF503 domain-containing protein [Anaerolineae bacterium]